MAKKTEKKKATAKKKAPAKKKATPVKKEAATTKKKETEKKKPAKPSRSRAATEIRLKAYWGVFNQSLRRVALFEFSQRKQADKKAQDLTKSGKSPHFVQPVKEVIES